MLISLQNTLAKYRIKPRGIIHVGAHWAEEHDDYVKMGANYVVYIEASKPTYDVLLKKFNGKRDGVDGNGCHVVLYNYACGEKYEHSVTMNVAHANQGQSNSILQPKLHLTQHPEVVFTDTETVEMQRVDYMIMDYSRINIFVADVQGYELQVLKGATGRLKDMDAVYIEVNRGETYENNALIEDVDYFLLQNDFERVETYWPSPNWTWGDAVYVRNKFL